MAASKSLLNVPVARRQFLKASSVAAIGFAATGLIRPGSLFGAAITVPLLGVGFTPADDVVHGNARLIDATSALAGDPTFISRGARLTISAFSPASRGHKTQEGAAIDAIFPILGREAEKYPRFQAWSFRAKESGIESGRGSFTMPVTATDGIRLVVRSLAAPGAEAPAVETQSPFSLSLGSSDGSYKLQKGTYVVAFRDANGSDGAPSWSRLFLARRDEGDLYVPGARFSYVIVNIDYAK
jgi:hypothetical protein